MGKKEMVKMKVLKDVPSFIGADGKENCSFNMGDLIKVEKKYVKLFIDREIAEISL